MNEDIPEIDLALFDYYKALEEVKRIAERDGIEVKVQPIPLLSYMYDGRTKRWS